MWRIEMGTRNCLTCATCHNSHDTHGVRTTRGFLWCVSSQVHQLEFILDSLVDEKDRSTQKRGDAAGGRPDGARTGHASTNSTSDGSSQLSLEISVSRPAEIEAALQQFVAAAGSGLGGEDDAAVAKVYARNAGITLPGDK